MTVEVQSEIDKKQNTLNELKNILNQDKESKMLQQDINNLVEIIDDKCYNGGPLHIVLEDCNVDTDSIKWCIENSIPKEENIGVRICSEKLCELLLPLTLEQRIEYLHIDPLTDSFVDIKHINKEQFLKTWDNFTESHPLLNELLQEE